jgi:hypothetical protein
LNAKIEGMAPLPGPALYRPHPRMPPLRWMMSTGYEHIENAQRISFKSIDQGVMEFDVLCLASHGAAQTTETRTQRVITVYATARPIIVALSSVLLIPPTRRALLAVFVATLDEVSATFKAGKDLATAPVDVTPQVDMEPKLPVG